MNYDKLRIDKKEKEYKIGEIITYKSHKENKKGLFIECVDNKIKLVLINNRLDQGVKVLIDKSQIV
jgi:hypothetical protein